MLRVAVVVSLVVRFRRSRVNDQIGEGGAHFLSWAFAEDPSAWTRDGILTPT